VHCSTIFAFNFVITPPVTPIKSDTPVIASSGSCASGSWASGFGFVVYNGVDFALVCFTVRLDFLDLFLRGLATATDVDGFCQGEFSILQ
jgi:hypothetical protein